MNDEKATLISLKEVGGPVRFGSPYKTVQVNNFNKLHSMASGST